MTTDHPTRRRFVYDRYSLDPERGELRCTYRLGERRFEELVRFDPGGDWDHPASSQAARLIFLLAGVSYYKTAAPRSIDLGTTATTAVERDFVARFYRQGLGEFAYRNHLDLRELEILGPDAPRGNGAPGAAGAAGAATGRSGTVPGTDPVSGPRPLVPFGGGIDSLVTVDAVRSRAEAASLFVLSREGDRFAAIERPAARTGLPVVRAERRLDPQVLASAANGFLNGHVPVTGIVSAIAVMAAVLGGHDAVVMSNEWSASRGNLEVDGAVVNHQWSKSLDFERGFRQLLAGSVAAAPDYFSLLRPYSELWVARRFAELDRYHLDFRSCNRAFHLDPAARLDRWCGTCDKCCFIDLVLSPYLDPGRLAEIFGGAEPLRQAALADRFRTLLGLSTDAKPFECVGDVGECRTAALEARRRPDRASHADQLLTSLVDDLHRGGAADVAADQLLRPMGEHFTPDAYSPEDQLV